MIFTANGSKHPSELPDDTLRALGFEQKRNPYTDGLAWTHGRSGGVFYFQVLTPEQVSRILIEIGHHEFLRRTLDVLPGIME
jgi:hypothetical protein